MLRNDLSQECGDLTPTLKVKRQALSARYQTVIDALYEDSLPSATPGAICPNFLYAGEAARN